MHPDSPTFKQWVAVEPMADNRCMLYILEGLAHGFQTLIDDTEEFYQMSEFYHLESACGVRWDGQTFGVELPVTARIISAKDHANRNSTL